MFTGLDSLTLYPWSDAHEEGINEVKSTFPLQVIISDIVTTQIPSSILRCEIEEDYLLKNFGTNTEDIMEKLQSSNMKNSIDKVLNILRDSLNVRVKKQPGLCKKCISAFISHSDVHVGASSSSSKRENDSRHETCKHPKVGLLFSGGLDSAVLAALAHEFIPLDEPIDLMNVAFEKSQSRKKTNSEENDYLVPDRITGRKTSDILKSLYHERKWNFVEVSL